MCCAVCGSSPVSSSEHAVELVQQLLEPQLVHLVDDDEEHLVVLGARGSRLLEREQLVDLQVAAVGDGSVRLWHHSWLTPWSTSSPTARISASALLRVTGPGFMR